MPREGRAKGLGSAPACVECCALADSRVSVQEGVGKFIAPNNSTSVIPVPAEYRLSPARAN